MDSSNREVYTARLNFIWVVKDGGEGGWGGISYYFVSTMYIPLLMLYSIELLG